SNGGFRATCYNHICLSPLDVIKGIYNGSVGSSAGGYSSVINASQPIFNRDNTGSYIYYHLGNKERIEPRGPISFCIFHYLLFKSCNTSVAGTPYYAYTVPVKFFKIYFGMAN